MIKGILKPQESYESSLIKIFITVFQYLLSLGDGVKRSCLEEPENLGWEDKSLEAFTHAGDNNDE